MRRWRGASAGRAETGRARWYSLGDRVRVRFGAPVTIAKVDVRDGSRAKRKPGDAQHNGTPILREAPKRVADTMARIEHALTDAIRDGAETAVVVLRAILEAGTLAIIAPAKAETLTPAKRANPPCAGLAMLQRDAIDAVRPYLFAD